MFFVWNSVCMLGNNFDTSVRLLFISLYFLLAQNLKFSKRLGLPEHACTVLIRCSAFQMHPWASRFPRICWGFTSLPCFPFKLLFSLLSQLLSIALDICIVNNCLWIFVCLLANIPGGKSIFTLGKLKVISYKESLASGIFQGPTR